jgi:hypothetical protein
VYKASDPGHGPGSHPGEVQRLPFELPDADVQRCRDLANRVYAAILDDEVNAFVPMRIHYSLPKRTLGQRELVKQMDPICKQAGFA